jgi:hypothetical protein
LSALRGKIDISASVKEQSMLKKQFWTGKPFLWKRT